jgi:integrase
MASVVRTASLPRLARQYLAHRRSLGRFAERVSPGRPITTATALRWATSVPVTRQRQAARLTLARGFAKYCAILDPRTEIPPGHLLGPYYVRRRPHIFTSGQVRLMMRRARRLSRQSSPLHPVTYETFIGLLACTGMRSGEARRLLLSDFDAKAGRLRIASSKFSPPRVIPLHPSVVAALERYRRLRCRLFPSSDRFFVGNTGRPLHDACIGHVLSRLCAGIAPSGERPSLRWTDFRHSFASNWIDDWGRRSKPASHHLLLLARYLGHRDFHSTWWYVSSDPKTLQAAAKTFLGFHKNSAHETE